MADPISRSGCFSSIFFNNWHSAVSYGIQTRLSAESVQCWVATQGDCAGDRSPGEVADKSADKVGTILWFLPSILCGFKSLFLSNLVKIIEKIPGLFLRIDDLFFLSNFPVLFLNMWQLKNRSLAFHSHFSERYNNNIQSKNKNDSQLTPLFSNMNYDSPNLFNSCLNDQVFLCFRSISWCRSFNSWNWFSRDYINLLV